eukprot:9250102-Pyramimonas_sp.AAC.1
MLLAAGGEEAVESLRAMLSWHYPTLIIAFFHFSAFGGTLEGWGGEGDIYTMRRVRHGEYTHASCIRLVRRENIPTFPASNWSVVKIYSRFMRLIGPSCEYTHASCV